MRWAGNKLDEDSRKLMFQLMQSGGLPFTNKKIC